MTRRRLLLAGVVLVVAAAAVELVLARGDTPPISGPDGEVAPRSVASLEEIVIGGVEQVVLIRGRDRTDPVVLFLHGGPGNPVMYLAHAFQRPLERDFVVVQWDRRGAGKSYDALGTTESLTVRKLLDDTHQLADLLRRRFDQERIYLLAHSWGSYLGVLAARERPELYRGFVGTGQVAAGTGRVEEVRRRALAERALAAGDTAAARAFLNGERPVGEDELFRWGGELRGATSFWPLLWTGLRAPEYTLFDALNVRRGIQRSGSHMRSDVIDGPLATEVRQLRVPVTFFLGRHDLNTPSALAAAYLERLDAPLKRLVWFERSAHFPFLTDPERFHRSLVRFHRDVVAFETDVGRNDPRASRRAPFRVSGRVPVGGHPSGARRTVLPVPPPVSDGSSRPGQSVGDVRPRRVGFAGELLSRSPGPSPRGGSRSRRRSRTEVTPWTSPTPPPTPRSTPTSTWGASWRSWATATPWR